MTRPTSDALSPATANAVFDLFSGSLGHGGKFRRNSGLRPDGTWGPVWYVDTYSELMTSVRRDIIDALNPLLDDLRARHEQETSA